MVLVQGFGGYAGALALVLLSCTAGAQAQDENLLNNPGFEQYDQGLPVNWDLFVMPQEGAAGSLDRSGRAAQGRNAILLSTDKPYEKEPFNNWSQNVLQDFKGKTVILKGAIRTQEATNAALWIQCWRKNPWTMLATGSSKVTAPVTGTADWTRVEVRLTAPRGTDYVTVRCVLEGTGKAWFDDLGLTTEAAKPSAALPDPAAAPPPPPRAVSSAKDKTPEPSTPNVDPSALTLPSLMGLLTGEKQDQDEATPTLRMPMQPIPPLRPTKAAAAPKPVESPAVENKSLQELMNANRMLLESYQALKQTNEELSEQVKSQQKEIQALRKRTAGRRAAAPKAVAQEAPAPAETETPAAETEAPPVEPETPEVAPPPLVPSTTEEVQ